MATCGEYEIDRAIGWGRRSTFFSARAIDDRGPSLIVIRRARTVERNQRHAFLRAAAEQQTAVGAGCRKLAPILAFDCDETGFAFYATTRFETSLAEFLEAECKTDSALLRDIVTSVLAAVAELQEKSRRAHGNLTPGNILLDPQGHIFLTDLAPSAKDATTADDLFALGKLIYQLVRRNSRVGELNPPLDYSPAWTESLGDDAEGWLAFTNRLLDKPHNSSPDAIQSALRDLKSLASLAAKAAKAAAVVSPLESGSTAVQAAVRRPPPKKKSPLPWILAALLLLGGGGGGFVYYRKQQAEAERQRKIAEELQRQKDVQKLLPGAIKGLADELKQLAPDRLKDGTAQSLLIRMGKTLGNSTSAEGAASEINSLIRNWDLPEKMKAQAKVWGDAPREWTRLAGELQSAAEVDARSEISIIVQFENAIKARGDASELDDQWDVINRTIADHKAAGNRMLPDFTPWAENEVRSARDMKDALDRAKAASKTLADVLSFQSNMGARVLWTRFETEVPELLQVPSSDLLPVWPTKWMSEAKRRVAPEDAKQKEWAAKLADIAKRIDQLKPTDPKLKDYKKKLEDTLAAKATAVEEDVAKIDKAILQFNDLELPAEIAHKRYKEYFDGWKQRVKAISPDDQGAKEQAKALIKEFAVKTKSIVAEFPDYRNALNKAGLGAPDSVAGTMTGLVDIKDNITLDFSRPDGSPDPDSPWKPAKAAYTDPTATPYVFMKDGKPATGMHFIKIDEQFAMAATETPLLLARLSGIGSIAVPRDQTGRQTNGPQTRTNDFFPADNWLWKSPAELLAKLPRVGGRAPAYFADGVDGGDRTDNSPVTWLTFKEAEAMAKALGGQLPTAEQWRAAKRKGAGAEKRLRSDRAWSKQYKMLEGWTAQSKGDPSISSSAPDYGSFSTQLIQFAADKGAVTGASSDGKLWLAEVGSPSTWNPTKGFIHLIGNAAEWVLDESGKPAVIGGSVVSPAGSASTQGSFNVDTPYRVNETGSYFDVTFRLVVKLGPGGAGVGLKEFQKFGDQIQLPPNPAAR